MEPDLHLLEVGKPYDPRRTVWPEGADYNFRGGHELRIFLGRATPAEVEAVRFGPVEFGFCPVEFGSFAEPAGLVLVARFGPSLSFDCSYHWHRMAEATGDRSLPPAAEETSPDLRALLSVILVEATTGTVLVLRAVTFSPEFTRSLHKAIADQAGGAYDRAGHRRWVEALTARYTTHQLWARCSIRCGAGPEPAIAAAEATSAIETNAAGLS
jgi:hypothetical protein